MVKGSNSYRHILKYTGIFTGVQGLNVLVGVVRNKFTVLFLGASGMGMLTLFNSMLTFVSSSCNLGIPTSGVRMVAESQEKICLVRSFSFLSALLGVIVCLLLGPFLCFFAFSSAHIEHFFLLAPTVFFTILAGGEMAVLKGLGKVKAQAIVASVQALLSLVFSLPIYFFFGVHGILAVLFLLAFSQWILCLGRLHRLVPFRIRFSRKTLTGGWPMLRMGGSFMISGLMASGVELLVRTFLCLEGSLSEVGLFNSGVTVVLVYGGMIFSVMDADYYPRLSAIKGEKMDDETVLTRNLMVNRQLKVNVLVAIPVVLLLIVLLPYIMPLLYSYDFLGVSSMAQLAAVGLLFKAVYLPIEYLPLARGEAKIYLLQECFASLLLAVTEIGGYLLFGLTGIGVGIVVAYLLESIGILVFSRKYYGFRISRDGFNYKEWLSR